MVQEIIKNKGLRANILQAVAAEANGVDIDVTVHQEIDSTNTWSLQQVKLGKTVPFACFAESQIVGKGRRGKQWFMSANTDIAMSICWVFDVLQQQLSLLPLSVALSVVKALEKIGIKDVQIKWPNDVYVKGKKIAGILIETQSGNSQSSMTVVIGVGLNYDMSLLEEAISDSLFGEKISLTDIKREINTEEIDRELVAAVLLQNIVAVCQNFHQNSDQYMEEFTMKYDFCKDKMVDVRLDNDVCLSGMAIGVNELAELIVNIDGEVRTFNSAEVSVRASL